MLAGFTRRPGNSLNAEVRQTAGRKAIMFSVINKWRHLIALHMARLSLGRLANSIHVRGTVPSMVVLAAVLILGSACSDPFAPHTVLEVETVLLQTSVGPEEVVGMQVTVFNPASKPVQFPTASSCLTGFQVTSPTGHRVSVQGVQGALCMTLPRLHQIAAGDSVVTEFAWFLGQFTERAPPGVYQVQGGLDVDGLLQPSPPVQLLIS